MSGCRLSSSRERLVDNRRFDPSHPEQGDVREQEELGRMGRSWRRSSASAWGKPVGSEAQNPVDTFETWLLRRVVRAVEAGKVSADLLTELRTEMERARELPHEEGHARAVQDIAEQLDLPGDQAEKTLAALEAQPTVTRELLLRHIVEAWLAGQRGADRARGPAGEFDAEH